MFGTRKMMHRLGVLAGLLALSLSATASDTDAQIYIDRAANSPSLTIRYDGAAAALAELRINGDSYGTRVLNPNSTSGETNFTLSKTLLNQGENQVEVRLFDKNGTLLGTQRTVIYAEKDKIADVFLSSPKSGATLQGPVEVKVGFGRDLKNSYVSFFVDNQFKLMTNFPPYSYMWDTMRENNGWHEIEAWVVDDTSATFKTKKVRIFVNNPGGHTNRIFTKPATPAAPVAAPLALKASSNPLKGADIVVGDVGLRSSAVFPGDAASEPAQPSAPMLYGDIMANPIQHAITAGGMSNLRLTTPKPVVATGMRDLTPTGTRIAPLVVAKSIGNPANAVHAASVAQSVRTGVLPAATVSVQAATVAPKLAAIAPAKAAVAVAATHAVAVKPIVKPLAKPIVKAATPKASPKAKIALMAAAAKPAAIKVTKTVTTLIKVEPGLRIPRKGNYAIVMDGKLVEFDVEPRIDEGVPMTPFRHLVEKEGGTVKWENSTKSVSANSDGRSIYLKIGTKIATVDNAQVEMELAPYLDRNRTIVPLSFMRDTLHVNIEYDKATNHVLITSIKN